MSACCRGEFSSAHDFRPGSEKSFRVLRQFSPILRAARRPPYTLFREIPEYWGDSPKYWGPIVTTGTHTEISAFEECAEDVRSIAARSRAEGRRG